jgi:hypothetical protein
MNGIAGVILAVTWFGLAFEMIPVEPLPALLKRMFGWRDETGIIALAGVLGAGLLSGFAVAGAKRLNPSLGGRALAGHVSVTVLTYFVTSVVSTLVFVQLPEIAAVFVMAFGLIAGTDKDLVGALLLFTMPAALACWSAFMMVARAAMPDKPAQSGLSVVLQNPWWATPLMWMVSIYWQFGSQTFCFWPLALPLAIAFAWKHGSRAYAPVAIGTLPLVAQLGDNAAAYLTPGGLWPAIAVVFWAHFVADASFRQQTLRRETLPWFEAVFVLVLLSADGGSILSTTTVSFRSSPDMMAATVAFVIGASRIRAWPVALVAVAAWCFWMTLGLAVGPPKVVRPEFDVGRLVAFLAVLYAARAWRRYALGFDRAEATRSPDAFIRANRQQSEGFFLATLAVFLTTMHFSSWEPIIRIGPVHVLLRPPLEDVLALAVIVGFTVWRALDRTTYLAGMPGGWARSLLRGVAAIPALAFLVAPVLAAGSYLGLLYWAGPYVFPGVFGVRRLSDDIYSSLAGCLVAFVLFGVALRIVAEQRSGESLRDVVRRLWREPSASVQEPSLSNPPKERELSARANLK